jgi:uncharacterized protein YkwD
MKSPTRNRAKVAVLSGLAGLASILLITAPGAAADLVAPSHDCAGQQNANAPRPVQKDAMRCLISYARDHAGAGRVSQNDTLNKAAGRKAGDVMRCEFSHTACGHPADLYPRRFGYASGSWGWGENLAWGKGRRGTARSILIAWLGSPPHRETMLNPSYEDLGVGMKSGSFSGQSRSSVWVMQVGCHGCG